MSTDALTRDDFDSRTWHRLVAWAEQERATCVADLIRPQTDETVTHRLRGRIKQIDRLLALPTAAPAQAAAPAMQPHVIDEY